MLVVSRKENEWIRIEPMEGLDPKLTLRDVSEPLGATAAAGVLPPSPSP